MNRNYLFTRENRIGLNTQTKADFMMLIVTMLWGSSYLFMKMGLDSLQGFNLIALRFGIAFILAGIVFYKRFMKIDAKTVVYGFLLGTILFVTISVVTLGLNFTSISNAGFLFSLSVVFVPLLLAIIFRKRPEKKVVLGISVSMIGIALLTLTNTLQINSGDFLITLGALFYATLIIVTDKLTKNVDSIALGILQLGFTGAWGLLFSFLFEKPQLPPTIEAWTSIIALSIFCSAIGFIGQTVAQKHTTPTHTGLIFSLEPVFAALLAFLFVGETLAAKGYLGAILILLGVLIAKIGLRMPILKKSFSNAANG